MDTSALVAVGLTNMQAEMYALLIECGEVLPPEAAKELKTTRTNAYKILDKLVELRLAAKVKRGSKTVYSLSNPVALASLTEHYRAEAVKREEAVSNMMHDLLAKYHTHSDKPDVTIYTGRKVVAAAYRKQLAFREDIYFIRTRADVPAMGFDVMHEIRTNPAKHGKRRYAIMTAENETHGPINYAQHERSNLEITWASEADYNAPVEWSVTNSSLLIVLYATEPHAIFIADPVVAAAFLQMWKLLSSLLKQQPLDLALHPKV